MSLTTTALLLPLLYGLFAVGGGGAAGAAEAELLDESVHRQAASAEAATGCLNATTEFSSGGLGDWTRSDPDDVRLRNKEGRSNVVELDGSYAWIHSTFEVREATRYSFSLDHYGQDSDSKITAVSVRWLDVNGIQLSNSVLYGGKIDNDWARSTYTANSPLNAVRAEWRVVQIGGKVWVDNLCAAEAVGQAGGGTGGGGGVDLGGSATVEACAFVNADFELGFVGWEQLDGPGDNEFEVKDGRVKFKSGSIRQAVPIEVGQAYQLTFRVKSDGAFSVYGTFNTDATERRLYRSNTLDDWHTISIYLGPRANVHTFTLRFAADPDKKLEVADACLVEYRVEPSACTLRNPKFAEGYGGWTTGNSTVPGVFEDRQALALEDRGWARQIVNVVGGAEYELSYKLFGSNESNSDQVWLYWRGADGFADNQLLTPDRKPERWEAYTHTVTAPPEATAVYVNFRSNGETFYVDDVCWASTAASADGCININGEFDYGLTGWNKGANNTFQVSQDGADNYLDVDAGWIATRWHTIRPGEAYYLNYELLHKRRGSLFYNAIKWYDVDRALIREEPLTVPDKGDPWHDQELEIVAPPNAVYLQAIWSLNGGAVGLDAVCISEASSRTVSCESEGQTIAAWLRADPTDGGAFEERYVSGQDAYYLNRTEVFHEFDVVPGQNYRSRFLLYGGDDAGKPTRLWLTWHRADDFQIGEVEFAERAFPRSWQELVYRSVAPPGAAYARVSVMNMDTDIAFALYCAMDAGAAGSSSVISGLVWADNLGDGVRTADEPPLGGVKLELYRDDGDGVRNPALDTKVGEQLSTSLSAGYFFTDLPAGDYYVVGFLLPTKRVSPFRTGFADDDSDFQTATLNSTSVGMTPMMRADGDDDLIDVDFGQKNSGKAAVSGYVWADADRNEFRNEANGLGLNGVRLSTYSVATGMKIGETETVDDLYGNPGYYLFNYITVEPVYVEIDLPTGSQLGRLRFDNKFDQLDNRSQQIALAADKTFTNISAALRLTGSEICDNGIDDDGDGRIDDRDSDCTACVVADAVTCGDDLRYYIPPMWQMDDPTEAIYNGPSSLVLSTVVAAANVNVRRSDGTLIQSLVVTNATSANVPLNKDSGQTFGEARVEQGKGLIVESDQPIQVIYTIQGGYNKAIVTIKGQQALGNSFFAGSQVAQYACSPEGTPGSPNVGKREAHFVSVMATEDLTRVTLDWDESKLTLAGGISSPHTFLLNAGETYLVRDDYTNETVSGVRVSSDKAIAVVSGSQHTNVCDYGGLDAGIDQLVPECYVGSEYVLVKHAGTVNQHYGVAVATANDTEIFVDNDPTPIATLDAGEWYRIMLSGVSGDPHYIRSTRPMYLYHVSGISNNNEVGMGLASAVGDCRGDNYLTFPMGDTTYDHQLNVVVATGALTSLELNGTPLATATAATIKQVPTRPDLTSVLVPRSLLQGNNILQADERFQAALLIGLTANSGTYGYLTSFAQGIVVRDPASNLPTPRYALDKVCGGQTMTHTVAAESCGSALEIVEVSNNTSYGAVTLLGGLTFQYDAALAAYGKDNIALRVRDENGNEVAVCIELFVCGESVPIYGLAPSQVLGCGQALPPSVPEILDTECPYTVPIVVTNDTIPGTCVNTYSVRRTWSAATDCGGVIRAERTYYYVDDVPPTFTTVTTPINACGSQPVARVDPFAFNACGGTTTISVDSTLATQPGTNATTLTRTWTATDECGNTATTSQVVNYSAYPAVTSVAVAQDATCGLNNGAIRIDFDADGANPLVQFSVDGAWTAPVASSLGAATLTGYPAGTYTLGARWSGGACLVDLGDVTIGTQTVSLGALRFGDLDGGPDVSITSGATYHLDDLPARWNLAADPSGEVGLVRYGVSGGTVSDAQSDATAPYRYTPDGAPLAWGAGYYVVAVNAYGSAAPSGSPCAQRVVAFTLIGDEICDNGIDDDGDGLVDCDDEDCPGGNPVPTIVQGG